MKKILPFKALAYNQEKVTSLKDVVTPPYDVISPEMQEAFYNRSPYNFCRIDLTKETGDARYATAGKVFQQWKDEGIFSQDKTPGIYVHHHDFVLPDGRRMTRKGFFAACRIQDYNEGGIKPHEKTLDGPKVDRFRLTEATKAQLSPVFSLYGDPQKRIESLFEDIVQTTPSADFVSEDGERHRLWKIKDPDIASAINTFMEARPLFIADGHHRYETALNYRNHILSQNQDVADQAALRYLLMYFSNLNDTGLVILPIHRALHGLSGKSLGDLLGELGNHFTVESVTSLDQNEILAKLKNLGEKNHAFWLLAKDPAHSYLLSLPRANWLKNPLAQEIPQSLCGLDVTVLHKLVIEKTLGISEEAQAKQENIIYWKSTEKAIAETRGGACELTFILNPTRIEDMEAVAMAGHKMPQKSTYFYPKIISGLLMHDVSLGAIDG